MSKSTKVSKEVKKFSEAYEIGKVWLPRIVNGLYIIRDMRCRNDSIEASEVFHMFDELNYFISYRDELPECENISLGKGKSMYLSLNRGMPIIPTKPLCVHSIVKEFHSDKNYVQYVNRNTPVFGVVKYDNFPVQLPEGLDIMELPEETMFQTEMCIDTKLVNGAAVWMGLRDFGYKFGEIIYYGDSLLKIYRLNDAVETVVKKLREKYEA